MPGSAIRGRPSTTRRCWPPSTSRALAAALTSSGWTSSRPCADWFRGTSPGSSTWSSLNGSRCPAAPGSGSTTPTRPSRRSRCACRRCSAGRTLRWSPAARCGCSCSPPPSGSSPPPRTWPDSGSPATPRSAASCVAATPATRGRTIRQWHLPRSGLDRAVEAAVHGAHGEDQSVTPTPTTDQWGIDASWLDALDEEHTVDPATIDALRKVIGTPPPDLEERAPIVARPGDALEIDEAEVVCEDGELRRIDGQLPADFPLGYHWLQSPEGRRRRLIVSPGRCWLPEGHRAWGWAVQLYATRSRASWGIGDLGDLRDVRRMAADQGAGFLLINPLHAVPPISEQEASPSLPATRRFRNPIYLRIAEVPGADGVDLEDDAGRALSDGDLIDRNAIWARKREVLMRIFFAHGGGEAFARWREEQGQTLQDWATWAAISEEHGADWHAWPPELRSPQSPELARYVEQHGAVVGFHAWLQWALELQFSGATAGMTVLQGLPIGVSGGGADAWAWQDVLAQGVSVGAPPDAFNSQGQDWGSPPLVPWRLRDADYEPFIQSIRATIAGAGGLRIDHVMGLFRLWWVPGDGTAADGAYVRYPADDLLDIVALESARAQALVVGEDLGTVEDGVREA